jgi:hypothetical protein
MNFGKEFTGDQLSNIMGSVTEPIVGWKVTVSVWRHLNIAWKRKLCRGSFDIFEQDICQAIHALQAGHSPTTEVRIYGLSPDEMLGASEDVFHLFLEASTEWQKLFSIVPGGLGLSYKDGRTEHFDNLVWQEVIKVSKKNSPESESILDNLGGNGITIDMLRDAQRVSAKSEATMLETQKQMLAEIKQMSAQVVDLQKDIQRMKQNCM